MDAMSDFMVSVNPANGEGIASYQTTPEADIEQGIKTALNAFVTWKTVPFAERSNCRALQCFAGRRSDSPSLR